MMRIENLAKNGPMGVLKPRCTIHGAGTRRSDICRRWRSSAGTRLWRKSAQHPRPANPIMPPCSSLSSTSPRGRAKRACLTATVPDGRACAWAGMKERAPLGPNQGTASTRRTTQPHISYTDPTPSLSTKTGQVHFSSFGMLCMTHFSGMIKISKEQNRLFAPVFNLSVLVSAISIANVGLMYGRVNVQDGSWSGFESQQFPKDVKIPVGAPTIAALNRTEPNFIDLHIGEVRDWKQATGHGANGVVSACFYAMNPIFVEYFEAYRPWIDTNVSRDRYQWPAPWTFAWIVRNAIVHNKGALAWDDPNRAPISWHTLKYSHADNRRQIIGPDLSVADLVILLLEMNEALDRLGCPI